MKDNLAYVLITPYSLTKSRTGGIISRILSLSGLRLAGARMFAPGDKMVNEYAATIARQPMDDLPKQALLTYIDEQLHPKNRLGITNRSMLLLFEGADATRVLRDRVVGSLTSQTRGDSVRGTYGDFVAGPEGDIRYFEPAVLIATHPQSTREHLAIFAKYARTDGGVIERVISIPKSENPETTLVILKPDNFHRQTSTPGNVIDSLSRTGLFIVGAKVLHPSIEQAMGLCRSLRQTLPEKLRPDVQRKACDVLEEALGFAIDETLAERVGMLLKKPNAEHEFFRIIMHMTGMDPRDVPASEHSKPGDETCLALLYKGPDAISRIRKVLGATNPDMAEGGTVRHMYGLNILENVAHSSHSLADANRERKIFDLRKAETRCEVKEIIDSYLKGQR